VALPGGADARAVGSHLLVFLERELLRVGGARPNLATGRVQIFMQEL
jgi:hypothetical protein